MKRFAIIFLLIVKSKYSFGKTDLCDTCKVLSVSVCPTEWIYKYYTIYLDYRVSKHFSFGVGAGHISQNKYFIGFGDDDEVFPWTAYNGTTVKLNGKYFPFAKKPGFYTNILTIYKDLYYSWVEFEDKCGTSGDEGSYQFIRSEKALQFGTSIILGVETKFSKSINLDFFSGITRNIRNRDYTTHVTSYSGTYCISSITPPLGKYTEKQSFYSAQLGIRVTIKIHEK